jgi:NADPH:quinone reductase-like Zn-dependent oxidoreductase
MVLLGCRCVGAEAVGVVEELGPGTSGRLTKGQRVVAADWGQVTYQEYVAVDEKHLVLTSSKTSTSLCLPACPSTMCAAFADMQALNAVVHANTDMNAAIL